MADRNERERTNAQSGRSTGKEQSGRKDESSEWLRDQVGEDHNLSGSSTYRTLPDQPEEKDDDLGAKDAKDRQSNR